MTAGIGQVRQMAHISPSFRRAYRTAKRQGFGREALRSGQGLGPVSVWRALGWPAKAVLGASAVALILFVFTTLLTWSYYGERAITFIYDRVPGSTRRGEKLLHIVWRVVWCLVIYLGATLPSQLVWRFGDISNAAMALPNLLALALLSGVVFALARGDRTAGPDHRAATPEEPEEY